MKTANRTFSRLLACALVFLLALTFAVPALAVPEKGPGNLKVTIRNNEGLPTMKTDQFNVYQLFVGNAKKEDVAVGENEWDAFSWNNYTLADIQWGRSVKDNGNALLTALKGLQLADAEWAFAYPKGPDGSDLTEEDKVNIFADVMTAAQLAEVLAQHSDNHFMQNFAKVALEKGGLDALKIVTELTEGQDGSEPPKDDDSKDTLTYTFTEPGYYLFAEDASKHTEGDAVSEYMLAVVGEQDILLKASVPTVDKDIVEGITDKKGNAAGVGDYVQFKLTGTLPKNFDDFDVYEYIFHDTLSKGLEFVQYDLTHPLEVRIYESTEDADKNVTLGKDPLKDSDDYKVVTTGTEKTDPKCNLEVSFENLKTLVTEPEITAQSAIVVTYWAKVTKDAVLLSSGNPNTVLLEYSNDPNNDGTGKTKEKRVYVYTFGLDLTKVDGGKKPLKGAGFLLKNEDGNYAIFENQWVLTAEDYSSQTFYASKELAGAANGDGLGKVTGPVRRLAGWTTTDSEPTTASVDALVKDYQDKKKAFDRASYDDQKEPSGSAYVALQAAKSELTKYLLESGEDGAIPDVYGLDAGDYTLPEVIVPDGYNTPKEDFDLSITANIDENGLLKYVEYKHGEEAVKKYMETYAGGDTDPAVPKDDTADNMIAHFKTGLVQDNIENQKAPFLPFTGGIGTLIFYILGIALIAGAVTYLVIASKKRKKAEENA